MHSWARCVPVPYLCNLVQSCEGQSTFSKSDTSCVRHVILVPRLHLLASFSVGMSVGAVAAGQQWHPHVSRCLAELPVFAAKVWPLLWDFTAGQKSKYAWFSNLEYLGKHNYTILLSVHKYTETRLLRKISPFYCKKENLSSRKMNFAIQRKLEKENLLWVLLHRKEFKSRFLSYSK